MRVLEFALASLLIEMTPGPNMAYLATLALAEGRRVGLAAVAGVALGLTGIGLASMFGLATLIETVPMAYDGLRYGGATFLLYLAWDAWRGAAAENGDGAGPRAAFRRALVTNLLNPKAAAFYVLVLPLFLTPAAGGVAGQTLLLVLIYVLVATAVHALIVLFAAALRPYLVEGPRERLVRRLLAVSIALVAVWFFWGTRR
ncbi:LysE family translocator [Rhabdaerophilum sp. SD176]|uniref:LysE family translocator n=1 Tax=Rhabdaerophilum sp. SD176 TaxID=2983548 RepID=UPI0024DF6E0C|nr:LysE family translocator [Rhabdaerophilum sp. SD176]